MTVPNEWGTVHAVGTQTLGSYVSVDTATGLTSLPLEEVTDFLESGGRLSLNGVEYDYTTVDPETNVLTLTTPLLGDAAVLDRVDALPIAVVKQATVVIGDDAVTARVPHSLFDRMVDGIREAEEQESVELEHVGGELVIRDVLGRAPVVDGSYIDPVTLPPPAASDGLAPASSPTPTVVGSVRQIHLKWDPVVNADLVTYDIHLSITAAFTAGPSTLVADTKSSAFIVQVENPDYTISYYLQIVARDADGSADAGAEVSTMLKPINHDDIAVDAVDANNVRVGVLEAKHASADFFQSGDIQTAASGRRVKIGLDGVQLIDTDESLLIDFSTDVDRVSAFYGDVQTASLLSLDNFEMRGTSVLSPGAVFNVSAGQHVAAAPPTVQVDYPTEATTLDNALYRTRSVDWGSTYDFICRRFFNVAEVRRITLIGGVEQAWYPPTLAVAGLAVANHASTEDRLFVIGEVLDGGTGTGVWTLEQYDYTSWPPTQTQAFLWPHDTGVQFFSPNVGRDFTNTAQFVTCEVLPNQTTFRFRRFSASTAEAIVEVDLQDCLAPGTSGSQLTEMADKNIRGCGYGTFGLGLGNLFMVAMSDRVWFFSDTGVFSTTTGFYSNGTQSAFAYSSVDSKFKGYNTDDSLRTTYTDWNVLSSVASVQLWAAYTWFDSAGTTHQTQMSAQKSFAMKKRGQVTFGTPMIPGEGGAEEPDSVKFYCGGPAATALARTSMWDQATQPAVGVTARTYETLRVASIGGAVNPPATNDFPDAVAAVHQSTALATDSLPQWLLKGDGSGRLREIILGQHVVKASDQGVTNSTVLVDASSMSFPVQANGVYEVEGLLAMRSDSSPRGMQVGWSIPSGVYTFGGIGPGWIAPSTGVTTQFNVTSNYELVRSSVAGTIRFGVPGNSVDTTVMVRGRLHISTTGGTAQLRFAQATAFAGTTVTMMAGSWLTVRRVA